jgi:hypothetical protein
MGADVTTTRGRDLIAAFELVHEAAMEGRLIAESDDMLDQEAAQLEALNQVYDFLTNHYEGVEDRFGQDPELTGAEAPGELDLIALREAAVDHPLNEAMLTTIELAAQQCTDDDLTGRLSAALDLVGAFWARRGAEICSETRSVSVPDGPE